MLGGGAGGFGVVSRKKGVAGGVALVEGGGADTGATCE